MQLCVAIVNLSTQTAQCREFLAMKEKTDAETIKTTLKDILLRCNLTIDDCRWQTYDGAANMGGSRNGVAASLSSENPCTLYIQCGNNSLDLALHDCVKESEIISDAFKVVQDLAVFIRFSPTQMAEYQHIVKDINDNSTQVENPHLLCPTRWTVAQLRPLSSINVSGDRALNLRVSAKTWRI